MFIKIFWLCKSACIEIYAIRKESNKIVGFTYPIRIKNHSSPIPHWTYHASKNQKPVLHHRSRTGKILKFMTLQEDYVKPFNSFSGVFWSAPGLSCPFEIMASTSNVLGHPDKEDLKVTFSIPKEYSDWTHYLNILFIEKNNPILVKQCLNQFSKGYWVVDHKLIDDGYQPEILLVFSRNKV